MDYSFNERELEVQKLTRDFAVNEIAPLIMKYDESQEFPFEITDKLGEMGRPMVFVYQGQEVKLCCGGCKSAFDKDPAKYMKTIRAADKQADKNTKN